MPSSFIDRDNGYKKLIKDLDGLGQLAGTVGIHAEEGSQDEADARVEKFEAAKVVEQERAAKAAAKRAEPSLKKTFRAAKKVARSGLKKLNKAAKKSFRNLKKEVRKVSRKSFIPKKAK